MQHFKKGELYLIFYTLIDLHNSAFQHIVKCIYWGILCISAYIF